MYRQITSSLVLAGLLLAGCSQQSAQTGRLSAALVAPKAAEVDLHDVVLHAGFHVQGLSGVSPAVLQRIDDDFERDLQNYAAGHSQGEDTGRTAVTTVAALKAQGLFSACVYAGDTQVVLKTARGAFQDVYSNNSALHPPFKSLDAIYDPQTGDMLSVGLLNQ